MIPTILPKIWNESLWVSYFTASVFRYIFTNNVTWTVNSFAHMYGTRPYDKRIGPRQSLIVRYSEIIVTYYDLISVSFSFSLQLGQ